MSDFEKEFQNNIYGQSEENEYHTEKIISQKDDTENYQKSSMGNPQLGEPVIRPSQPNTFYRGNHNPQMQSGYQSNPVNDDWQHGRYQHTSNNTTNIPPIPPVGSGPVYGPYDGPSRQPKRKKKQGSGFGKKFLTLVASALIFGVIAGTTMIGIDAIKDHFSPSVTSKIEVTTPKEESTSKEGQTTEASNASISTTDVSQVVEQVMPSVVSITCTIQSTNYFYGAQESQGAGSGFIIAKNKEKLFIATNNHVVNGATSLSVAFNDGSTAEAEIVGTDQDADLAVISVKAEKISDETAKVIKVAVLGESDKLKVGQPVIAIGNALGYGQSVTTGVISAKNREISFADGTMTLLQTDAAINPGNSGGVLINEKGEVIGINNAKLADTSVEGMGYAIPMSTAKAILTDLMNATSIKEGDQAFLGVVGKTIDSTYSEALGMPSGIYVSQVVTGSPAEVAGISAGDVITKYEGSSISTMEGLKDKLARKAAGTKVKITLQRANQNGKYEEQTLEVTLGKKSDFKDATANESSEFQDNSNNQYKDGNGNNQQPYQEQNPYDNQDPDSDGQYIDPFEYFFGGGNLFR